MLVPTSYSPRSKIQLEGGLTLSPGKRVAKEYSSNKHYFDSVIIDGSEENVKSLLVFHGFVADEDVGVTHYEQYGSGDYRLIEIEGEPAKSSDYNDIAPTLMQFTPNPKVPHPAIAYTDLFKTYLQLSDDKKPLFKTYLTDLYRFHTFPSRILLDSSYWQLVLYYAIAEAIIGKSEDCCQEFNCTCCNREGLRHPRYGRKTWFKKRLLELCENSECADDYASTLEKASEVRHPAVHTAIHPTAEYVVPKAGITSYDGSGYLQDEAHLQSLVLQVKDVARGLLLIALDIQPR